MNCEKFVSIRFQAKSLAVIEQANYQFVARDLINNTFNEYKRLDTIIRNGRDTGLIDWSAIEDRTREVNTHTTWTCPENIIDAAARQYCEDQWRERQYRPEVWIEKDALIGVVEEVCTEYRVPYFAHRGNNSQTLQHQAGKRFARYLDQGLKPVVLHFADHDPNGIDMTRDNIERLAVYARADIEVRRLALNMDQVRRYRPPPNFAKETDKRFRSYVTKFGNKCWELDALSPTVIADLIRVELKSMIKKTAWRQSEAQEQRNRNLLRTVAGNWTKVQKMFQRRAGRA